MKVLSLQCGYGHAFEGWFASEDDFRGQLERSLLECPMCGDKGVTKLPSAPRLNLGSTRASEPEAQPLGKPAQADASTGAAATPEVALQAAFMKMVRHVMANTEDVGTRFAEEARKIHYGESEERGIRGKASPEETEALLDEGIGVLPLPLPHGLKDPIQ